MRHLRMLIFLMGVLRVLGMFPYRINRQSAAATFSWPLLVYSIFLTVILWVFSIYVQLIIIPRELLVTSETQYVMLCFMNISYLICVFLMPLYFLMFGRRLAKPLASLLEFHDEVLYRSTENKFDKKVFCHFLIFLFFGIFTISTDPTSDWIDRATRLLDVFYAAPSRYIIPLFYNAFFKLLSLMLAFAFTPLEKGLERGNSQIKVDQNLLAWDKNKVTIVSPYRTNSHADKTRVSENKNKEANTIHTLSRSEVLTEPTLSKSLTPSFPQQEKDALLFARRSMILLEGVEASVTSFLAPMISVQLLMDSILNVVFMIFILGRDTQGFSLRYAMYTITVTLQIFLMLEAPEIYNKKVRGKGTQEAYLLSVAHFFTRF